MYGPRPIRFSAHWCADYSKYQDFQEGGISTASSLLPFFGTRLRRQNFNLAPSQYCQLRRLTLQPLMPSTTSASLTSSPSCLSSAILSCCPVSHTLPQPSIPTLQSLTAYFNPAFPELCIPNFQSLLPSLSPACAV